MPTEDLISVKELASKLNVTDALLKKYIRDFEIETERIKKRIHLSKASADILKEIIQLRDSGKKNTEIKALFTAAQAGTPAPAAQAEEKAEESEDAEEVVEAVEEKTKKKPAAKTKKETNKKTSTKVKKDSTEEKASDRNEETLEETTDPMEDEISNYIADELHEQHELHDELSKAIEDTEGDDDDEEIDIAESTEPVEEEQRTPGGKLRPRKVRRRAFSFRFIQRQIANDQKRINYIRHKLSKSQISTLERKHLEYSLDQRSRLLNSWVQLMRWVKS